MSSTSPRFSCRKNVEAVLLISYPPLVPRSTVCLLLACSPKWKMFARMKTFGEHGSQIRRGASRYMRENISPKGPHFLLMPTCLNLLLSSDEHAFIRARIPHTHLFGQMKLATRRKLSATTGSLLLLNGRLTGWRR